MPDDFDVRFIKPIINASYPSTLAALDLTVLTITGVEASTSLRITLLAGATAFLLSALSIFAYGLYPTRRRLWSMSAITFLLGLFASFGAVILLFIASLLP